MQINLKTISKSIICLLVVSTLLISTGCRSGMFKKPDMSALAFWKKDKADSTMPPPPARHFDPAPIDGMEQAIAASDKALASSDRTIDVNQSEFAKRIDSRLSKARSEFDKKTSDPIRKPYSLGESDRESLASTKTPSFSDGFNAAKNNVASKANEFVSNSTGGLTQAQKDFKSAVGNATASTKDALASTTSKASNGWKDFKLPTELSSGKKNVDQSLQAVNKSLYDASGKLNSVAEAKKSSVSNGFSNATNAFADASAAVQNTFDSNVAKASKTTDAASNSFGGSFGQVKEQANGFVAAAQDKLNGFTPTQPDLTKPLQNFGLAVSQGRNAIAEKSNNLMQPLNNAFAQTAQPQATGPLTPATTPANQELQSVQAQVAEAKMQIEMLKQQVADAQRLASTQATAQQQMSVAQPNIPTFQATTPSQPMAPQNRVAQLQVPRFTSQPSSVAPTNLNNAPMNILRATTPLKPQSQPLVPQTQNDSGFQSTPHGGFSPRASTGGANQNFAPTSSPEAKQVNFESQYGNATNAANASMTSQGTSQSGVGNAFSALSPVSDVDIPASILQGQGSYAPGSVNRLITK